MAGSRGVVGDEHVQRTVLGQGEEGGEQHPGAGQRRASAGSLDSSTFVSVTAMAAMPRGMLMKKIHRPSS
ncbi:MAG: hypothetical protein ACRDNS_27985 [Trebonia sp.]